MKTLSALAFALALSATIVTFPALGAQPAAGMALRTAALQLDDLAERYYQQKAGFNPLNATLKGDNSFDAQLPMTMRAEVRARMFAMLKKTRRQLAQIDIGKLDGASRTTYDLLSYDINEMLRFEPFDDYLLPMSHLDVLPVTVAAFGTGRGSQALSTVADYKIYAKRVAALTAWTDASIGAMRTGIKKGIVQPRALVLRLIPQLKTLAATPLEQSNFYAPIRNMPAAFSAADKKRLTSLYRRTVHEALRSMDKLSAFVETDYLTVSRTTSGLGALPNGAQWYRAHVANHTSTSLEPDEIHRLGLAEVARLTDEFAKVGVALGYTGPPAGLATWTGAQAKFRPFRSEQEVVDAFGKINDRIAQHLPTLFGKLPRSKLVIQAEPAISRASAYDRYDQASADGQRPGIFWAVIPDPTLYGSTEMTSLLLHEASPGHHLHFSLQLEMSIPKFRRFGSVNAFSEGWGLYAETLGKEIGLYEDANAYAGHLLMDMMRAARLVVDTGLHAKGWTREETVKYLMDTVGDSEASATSYTERYMAWPGQALSYKIGALKIMELRQRAAKALGSKFNLAKFHDKVLAEGTLPLTILEGKLDAWIAEQARL